jgi:hypothetical protein
MQTVCSQQQFATPRQRQNPLLQDVQRSCTQTPEQNNQTQPLSEQTIPNRETPTAHFGIAQRGKRSLLANPPPLHSARALPKSRSSISEGSNSEALVSESIDKQQTTRRKAQETLNTTNAAALRATNPLHYSRNQTVTPKPLVAS